MHTNTTQHVLHETVPTAKFKFQTAEICYKTVIKLLYTQRVRTLLRNVLFIHTVLDPFIVFFIYFYFLK